MITRKSAKFRESAAKCCVGYGFAILLANLLVPPGPVTAIHLRTPFLVLNISAIAAATFGLILYIVNKVLVDPIETRLKNGCCLNCGYDLRASTERCPECGTPFNKQPA